MGFFSGVFFEMGLSATDLDHFFARRMDPGWNRGILMDSDRYLVRVTVSFGTSWNLAWEGSRDIGIGGSEWDGVRV